MEDAKFKVGDKVMVTVVYITPEVSLGTVHEVKTVYMSHAKRWAYTIGDKNWNVPECNLDFPNEKFMAICRVLYGKK